ncbi:hypothetical protein VTJ49DRAFT_3864 [Mycothermus thermophilus]|uniref:Fe2OG dioxygenase domain-containing protein n=1 Tax=Humicola insolens TaxID=85995 RepID=A0ABR3VQQ9_HUMIN
MALRPPPPPTIDPANPNIWRWEDMGLTLIHNFITEAEEAALINGFHAHESQKPKQPTNFSTKKRISQHFGYNFDYTTFSASPDRYTPIPDYIASILPRLPQVLPGEPFRLPDQLTVQYYPPGSGIPPHVDTHSAFGEALYSLSYGGAVPMQFRPAGPNDARKMRLPKRSLMSTAASPEPSSASSSPRPASSSPPPGTSSLPPSSGTSKKEEEEDPPAWDLILPPRSLLIMTGPSRYGYVHGIRSRKTDVIPVRMLEHLGQVGVTGLGLVAEQDNGEQDTVTPTERAEEDGEGEKVVVAPRRGRYSLTMRTVEFETAGHCECAYPGVCDARIRQEQLEEQRKTAQSNGQCASTPSDASETKTDYTT